jgi:MFS family permease
MSVESLTAHTTPPELKGRAGGWLPAGSLGGSGIGGGLGLWLVDSLPKPWMASCIVGALCLLCVMALISVPTPARPEGQPGLFSSFVVAFKDVWLVLRNRAGALAFMLCLLPIGSGAAPFAAIAGEWRASADTVALITGVLGGIISAVGCLVGGWLCDRMDRKIGYVWFGLIQAASGLAMAMLPHDQAMYILWASVYTFTTGLTYAAFSSFVLEAIGKGAAATKYNALASLSNVPIYYMTRIDGWSNDAWGSRNMFLLESAIAVTAALIFLFLAKVMLPRRISVQP